jgi:ubiquinone/menaquinone biosynthesis C-methylase UbiE
LAKLLGAKELYNAEVARLELAPAHRVLDIGCGTGTLAVLIQQLHPGVAVVGLDPDPRALAHAARKAERAGVQVHFDRGFSDQLPYADASFDRVYSNIFSLLPREEKETTLGEVRRVLKPGGSFHLTDLAKTPPGFSFWRLFKPTQRYEFCTGEQILALMREAGFTDARITGQYKVWFWSFASYRASA